MVEVFFVHPDLNITDCHDHGSIDLKAHRIRYIRALKQYEDLMKQVEDAHHVHTNTNNTSNASDNESDVGLVSDSEFDSGEESSSSFFTTPSTPVISVTVTSSSGSGSSSSPAACVSPSKSSPPLIHLPEIPTYHDLPIIAQLSDLELTMLEFYQTNAQLNLAELNYATSYTIMNKSIAEVFSKAELSFEEEEKGIQAISKYTDEIKSLEKQLNSLRSSKSQLALKLTDDYNISNLVQEGVDNVGAGTANVNGSGGGGFKKRKSSSSTLNSIKEEETAF